jgi:ribosomal protein S18 acetylase RimI-like enzyme
MTSPVPVRDAVVPDELGVVRELFREYADRLGVDLCFQGFAAELAGLPGDYAPPAGRLLLADAGGAIAGCAALRPISASVGEMKRLYVRPAFRGRGVGRDLVLRVLADARAVGYSHLYLDTLPQMAEAIRLYESLGFRDIPPYRANPVPGARFLALNLASNEAADTPRNPA